MRKHTLFLESADPEAGELYIEGEEAEHATRVKRLRAGDAAVVLNGQGLVVEAEVVAARRGEVALRVVGLRREESVRPRVEVFAALPKGPRASDLVDALSQVGAARWTPLETERSEERATGARLERLRRVAIEAAKQCGRAWLMEIGGAVLLGDALKREAGRAGEDVDVVFADAGAGVFEVGKRAGGGAGNGLGVVRVLIGPEGGWTEDERADAARAGARVCSLGPHVMRIETAAATAAAIVIHEWARALGRGRRAVAGQ